MFLIGNLVDNSTGFSLREITRSPKFAIYEIQCAQHKAYMKEIRLSVPKGKNKAPGPPLSTALNSVIISLKNC